MQDQNCTKAKANGPGRSSTSCSECQRRKQKVCGLLSWFHTSVSSSIYTSIGGWLHSYPIYLVYGQKRQMLCATPLKVDMAPHQSHFSECSVFQGSSFASIMNLTLTSPLSKVTFPTQLTLTFAVRQAVALQTLSRPQSAPFVRVQEENKWL